jgi:hypothetical protein
MLWLRNDLFRNLLWNPHSYIYIFMHHPATGLQRICLNYDKFAELCGLYGVRAVLGGHVHADEERPITGSIYFDNVTLAGICGKTERMSAVTLVEKKTCLILNAGEYRLRKSGRLGRNFGGTGSDFGSVSRPRPETPVHTLWRTCVGR